MISIQAKPVEAHRWDDFRQHRYRYHIPSGKSWEDRIRAVQEAKRADPGLTIRELAMICFEGEIFVMKALRDATVEANA